MSACDRAVWINMLTLIESRSNGDIRIEATILAHGWFLERDDRLT